MKIQSDGGNVSGNILPFLYEDSGKSFGINYD